MSKILNLFKSIDQLLFERIDRMKNHPSYQKFLDKIAILDERKQKIVNHSIVMIITTLPMMLLIFVFIGNCSIKNSLTTQKEIYDLLNGIKNKRDKIATIGQQFFASHIISNKAELQSTIKNLLAAKQIPISKISISSFKQSKSTKTISEVQASISFNQFSITDLSKFLTVLIDKEKVKITNLDISKGKNNSLEGVIQIIHHGKSV